MLEFCGEHTDQSALIGGNDRESRGATPGIDLQAQGLCVRSGGLLEYDGEGKAPPHRSMALGKQLASACRMTRHQGLMVEVQDEDSVLCHEYVTFPRIDGVFSKLAFRSSSPCPVGREVLKTRSRLTQGLSACPADASDWRSIRLCLSILSQRFLHQSFPRLLGAGQRGKTHKPAPFRGGSLTSHSFSLS